MLKRLFNGLTNRGRGSSDKEAAERSTVPIAPVAVTAPKPAFQKKRNAKPAARENKVKEIVAEAATEPAADNPDKPCTSYEQPAAGIVVDLEIGPGDDALDTQTSMELLTSFYQDLEHDRFKLSSLPDTAMRIRQLLNDPDIQVSKLADVIGLDAAMAAKLLRVSNSALYASTSRTETIQSAVLRLGLDMTRQIVMSFAMKDLLDQCPAKLRKIIDQHWEHTIRVSAISYVLAQRTHICPPEVALLAGILSNIGVFSVFNYLGNYPEICKDREHMEACANSLKAEVGAMVLEKWEFSEELVDCARHCDDWNRETEAGNSADLGDLVIVAALHAYIGKRKLPPFHEVPAFNRISGGNLTAEKAVEFMSDAAEDIQQAMTLFYGS